MAESLFIQRTIFDVFGKGFFAILWRFPYQIQLREFDFVNAFVSVFFQSHCLFRSRLNNKTFCNKFALHYRCFMTLLHWVRLLVKIPGESIELVEKWLFISMCLLLHLLRMIFSWSTLFCFTGVG